MASKRQGRPRFCWRYSGAINFVWQGNYASAIAQFFSFTKDTRLSSYAFDELKRWLADLLGYPEGEWWFEKGDVGEGWQKMDFSEAKGLGFYYAVLRLEDDVGRAIAWKKVHLRLGRRGATISSAVSEVASWFLRRVGFR